MGMKQLREALSLARNSKITAIHCYWLSVNTFRVLRGVISKRPRTLGNNVHICWNVAHKMHHSFIIYGSQAHNCKLVQLFSS